MCWQFVKPLRNSRIGNDFVGKWVGNVIPVIWSVSRQDSDQGKCWTTVALCWHINRWLKVRKGGHFLLWANAKRQYSNNSPTLTQSFCVTWVERRRTHFLISANVRHRLMPTVNQCWSNNSVLLGYSLPYTFLNTFKRSLE